MITTLEEQIEEFDCLMQAGIEEMKMDDSENAEEFFSDAAHVLNNIQDEEVKRKLQYKYMVNPLDFAN